MSSQAAALQSPPAPPGPARVLDPRLKIVDRALGHFYRTCGFEPELRSYVSDQARS